MVWVVPSGIVFEITQSNQEFLKTTQIYVSSTACTDFLEVRNTKMGDKRSIETPTLWFQVLLT